MASTFYDSAPAEFAADPNTIDKRDPNTIETEEQRKTREYHDKVKDYVIGWRNQLRTYRYEKLAVWNECWQLYRGQEDWSDKEDWQSKIVLPKAFSTVKQATNVIKRFLSASKKPFQVEPENPNDQVAVLRAERMTKLAEVFLEKARFLQEFSEGLECGFIMSTGIMKLWWGLKPRMVTRVETVMVPMGMPGVTTADAAAPQQFAGIPQPPAPSPSPTQEGLPAASNGFVSASEQLAGPDASAFVARHERPLGEMPSDLDRQYQNMYPTQLPNEFGIPMGLPAGGGGGLPGVGPMMVPHKQIVREEILEGKLFMRAVDPYNFYWLPGSKMNAWSGTLEDAEIPKWEMLQMAKDGIFDMALIKDLQPMKIEETTKQSWLRFGEMPRTSNGPTPDTGVLKLTEFYGPIVIDGEIMEQYGHVLIVNDSTVLLCGKNQLWDREPPYVGYSPVTVPFRTEGVGLIEQVRQIDKALNRIINMGADTLMFRLMPLFEYAPEAYENPDDLQSGLVPGKMLRRNLQFPGAEGIKPVVFQDISAGATQLSSELNVAHQEGSLISQLQQSIPRSRGIQTATETQAMQDNQQSFFGSMAADIESGFLAPIITKAVNLILQFLDTANDPRVASILGMEAAELAGMTREEIMEMIQGDYKIKVTGVTGQIEKAEMLQNLVQFMNLIGQNPQAWVPYINQDKLLQRILEAFRPAIHEIEEIIATPEMVQANQQAMMGQQVTPDLIRMIPELVRIMHDQSKTQFDQAQAAAEQTQQHHAQDVSQGLDIAKHVHAQHATDVSQAIDIAGVKQNQQALDAPVPTPAS